MSTKTAIQSVCEMIPGTTNAGARRRILAAYRRGGARAARNVILDIAWSGGTRDALIGLLAEDCRAEDAAEMDMYR
jgi:hypothetical protein